jgi:hypothetical protein
MPFYRQLTDLRVEIVNFRLVLRTRPIGATGKYIARPSIACRFHVLTLFG